MQPRVGVALQPAPLARCGLVNGLLDLTLPLTVSRNPSPASEPLLFPSQVWNLSRGSQSWASYLTVG